jgi:phosphoserine phosphatase
MKPFPKDKLAKLLQDLEKFRPKGRAVAAFDADGTLWNTDLGEGLFSYEIDKKTVPLPADPWQHYQDLKDKVSHPVAYLWLAQINKGVPIAKVREWANAAVKAMHPVPVFDEAIKIIEHLKKLEVEVYIVTASIKWAVEPGARLVGLTADDVIGIETEVVNGVVTEKQKGPITWRQGKVEGLLARTGGVPPYFAAGNTEGDLFLLESSTSQRLVMAAAPAGSENYPTEQTMLKTATDRGWHSHYYS